MRASILSMGAILLTACMVTAAAHATMQDDVNQAVSILERFQEIPESAIPDVILRDAKGLAILTITKAGFVFSGRGGSGIVVARTDKGWSGPSAIGAGGMGFGFQAGAQVSELVIVLNTPDAVVAFAKGGNVTLGGAMSLATGPVGRDLEGSMAVGAVMYTYSRSQGLFAGVSLEGTVIGTRDEANTEYYGKPVQARDILSGSIAPPAGAEKLLKFLSKYGGAGS
ncbi:MAG TPA: YSC84-related protein [Candidatus Binatia bacterium]|nr:YSC84-related protein [Candidatus Binatia bacterium]